MAFQAGTQVDPRLMQADFSGFTKAAEIQAQGMANFAKSIGGGVEKFAKKRKEKKDEEAGVKFATEWAKNNPEMAQAIGFDVTDDEGFYDESKINASAKDFYKTVGKDSFKTVIPTLISLQVKSETAASDANKKALETLRDPVEFARLQSLAASDEDMRIVLAEDGGTGGMYQLEIANRPGGVLGTGTFKDYRVVNYDDPEAAMFRGQPGSAFLFGDQGLAQRRGQFPGPAIPRRPEGYVAPTPTPTPTPTPPGNPDDPGGYFSN